MDEFELAVESPEPLAPTGKPSREDFLAPGVGLAPPHRGEASKALRAILGAVSNVKAKGPSSNTIHTSSANVAAASDVIFDTRSRNVASAAASADDGSPSGTAPMACSPIPSKAMPPASDLRWEATGSPLDAPSHAQPSAAVLLPTQRQAVSPVDVIPGQPPRSLASSSQLNDASPSEGIARELPCVDARATPSMSSPFPLASHSENGGRLSSPDLIEPRLACVQEMEEEDEEEEDEREGRDDEGAYAVAEDVAASVGRLSLSSGSEPSPGSCGPEGRADLEEALGDSPVLLTPLQRLLSICSQEVRAYMGV